MTDPGLSGSGISHNSAYTYLNNVSFIYVDPRNSIQLGLTDGSSFDLNTHFFSSRYTLHT